MLKLNVIELLEEKGRTKYWLYKQLGMSYQNFSRMINNETCSIKYENIEAMCQLLECTPNELFVFTDELDGSAKK
ncbi:helix-turn-helix domain-containing protein [Ruminococcus flavefaciens]|uniref:Putative transcriptional regulator n=1 Tax=Ruminococcus flavefaciens TaxID=1265 RepID=A0A1K1NTU3_RUMFL|nr:helix-turn-helix transcriptional regulator [Ruminococcus flavefaciens]SFW38689.1 putative transcriptional regulator [Ruminococcus flavefaciens]